MNQSGGAADRPILCTFDIYSGSSSDQQGERQIALGLLSVCREENGVRAPPHPASRNRLSFINQLYIQTKSLKIQRVTQENVVIALGVG